MFTVISQILPVCLPFKQLPDVKHYVGVTLTSIIHDVAPFNYIQRIYNKTPSVSRKNLYVEREKWGLGLSIVYKLTLDIL